MKILVVETGFGYLTRAGVIVQKYELPAGEHSISDDLEAVAVADKTALDLVTIAEPVKTQEQVDEEMIAVKASELIRAQAISALTAEGKITAEKAAALNVKG